MQYLALDLGNVVFDLDFGEFWQLVAEMNLNTDDMNRYLKIIEKPEFCGYATFTDYMLEAGIAEHEAEALATCWNDLIKENKEMTEWIASIKKQGVKIAYLSNIGLDELSFARKTYPHIFQLADVQHMSCEVGAAKPSKLFYQSFLQDHPEFRGCTYLDDKDENVEGGSSNGLTGIKFELNNPDRPNPPVDFKFISAMEDIVKAINLKEEIKGWAQDINLKDYY